MVRNARRQARRRGLVPRCEPRRARPFADLVLAEIRLVERTDHAELARRLAAGTIIAAIVGVAAVDHGGEAALAREGREPRVELVLAVVAAVGRIRAVVGVVELRSPDHFVAQRKRARGADREIAVAIGVTEAVGGA